MKQKKIPMRKCVVSNERFPKKELIRVVKNNDNEIFVDPTGKKNGRGAYIQLNKNIIDKAKKTKILNKHLEIDVPEHIYEELYSLLSQGD